MQPTLVRGEGCSCLGFGEKLEGMSFWGVCVPGCAVPVKLMPATVVVPKNLSRGIRHFSSPAQMQTFLSVIMNNMLLYWVGWMSPVRLSVHPTLTGHELSVTNHNNNKLISCSSACRSCRWDCVNAWAMSFEAQHYLAGVTRWPWHLGQWQEINR